MRSLIIVFGVVGVTLAWGSLGRASILSVSAISDNSALALTDSGDCSQPNFAVLTIASTQSAANAGLQATLITDTPSDPTLEMLNSLDNDTGVVLTGYGVGLSMPISFTISNPTVTPTDWATTVQQPTYDPTQNDWTGYVGYQAGTPVEIGGELDFGYTISFAGSTYYQVTENWSRQPQPGARARHVGAFVGWALCGGVAWLAV